ncbi:hypothetical protein HZC07_01590 [Candidatus Micrarchaeota archaeon]|nr:hypothetical protein [Candidatus Micrarchaeota archaeon]
MAVIRHMDVPIEQRRPVAAAAPIVDRNRDNRDKNTRLERAIERAAEYVDRKQYDRAIKLLDEIRSEHPRCVSAITLKMKALSRTGQHEAVESLYSEASALGVCDGKVYASRIHSYGAQRNIEAARVFYENTEKSDLTTAAILRVYGKAGYINRAEQCLQKAEIDGHAGAYTYASMVRAYLVIEERKLLGSPMRIDGCFDGFSAAEKLYLKAKEKDLDAPVFYASAIGYYRRLKKPEKVQDLYAEAIRREKDDEGLHAKMIEIYGKEFQPTLAMEVYDRAVRRGKIGRHIAEKITDVLYKAGLHREILEYIKDMPPEVRESIAIECKKANALGKFRRHHEAIRLCEKLLRRNDLDVEERIEIRTILAHRLRDCDRKEEAFELFKLLCTEAAIDSWLYPRILAGLVFTWSRLEPRTGIDRETAKIILDTIRYIGKIHPKGTERTIDRAREVLLQYYPDLVGVGS